MIKNKILLSILMALCSLLFVACEEGDGQAPVETEQATAVTETEPTDTVAAPEADETPSDPVQETPEVTPEEEQEATPEERAEEAPEETAAPEEETPAPEDTPTPMSDEALISQGGEVFMQACQACHQAEGQGVEGSFPALAGNSFVTVEDPAPVINVVLTGRGGMPAFQGELSDQEIAAVISYIRNSWGNSASVVHASQVSDRRAAFQLTGDEAVHAGESREDGEGDDGDDGESDGD